MIFSDRWDDGRNGVMEKESRRSSDRSTNPLLYYATINLV